MEFLHSCGIFEKEDSTVTGPEACDTLLGRWETLKHKIKRGKRKGEDRGGRGKRRDREGKAKSMEEGEERNILQQERWLSKFPR